MIFKGKFKIIENKITACDYEFVLKKIEEAVKNKKSLLISPIASHTLVRAKYNKNLKKILDGFEYLVPDSQWVRWSLDWLYGVKLPNRVYGPELMFRICALSEKESYKIFLYGTTLKTLSFLKINLKKKFPKLKITGLEPSKFRELTKKEWQELVDKIIKSKADIIFVGLGSPLQEIFSYKLNNLLKRRKVFKVIIPVGAAFDFISGVKKQAPKWMGEWGLEWLFRLINEPRFYERYLIKGVFFLIFIFFCYFKNKIKKLKYK
jgi:N-acetylglucosaminyldiphosphoundecaprenol N-acetyl-beta-D-mannosaminyltransferase